MKLKAFWGVAFRALAVLPLAGVATMSTVPAIAAEADEQAAALAAAIVAAVQTAVANGTDIQDAVDAAIANAGVSPTVADAALTLAQNQLTMNGQLTPAVATAMAGSRTIVLAQLGTPAAGGPGAGGAAAVIGAGVGGSGSSGGGGTAYQAPQ